MSARPRRSTALALATALAVVGCSDSGSDAATAATTCEALREVNNRIVEAVNISVAGIGSLDPDERIAPIIAGSEDIRTALDEWDDSVAELDLSDDDEGQMLREQLADGVAGAVEALDAQVAEFATVMTVTDDDVAGTVGNWFNAVEKVVSSLEPEVFRLERTELKQAFLDEPDCRNVVQPFVND